VGYFSDSKALRLDGTLIEVEGRVGWSGASEFTLIVGNTRVDTAKGASGLVGFAGRATLRGRLPDGRAFVVTTVPAVKGSWLSGSVLSGMRYEFAMDDLLLDFGDRDSPPEVQTKGDQGEPADVQEIPVPVGNVEGALRELEELKLSNLITDAEYAAKRQEILACL
jgi:hypothetical protein